MQNRFSHHRYHTQNCYKKGIKQVKQQLQENSAEQELNLLRSLINSLPHVIWQADLNGQFTYLNSYWCTITGLAIDAGLGNGYLEVIHPEDRQKFLNIWQQHQQNSQPLTTEIRIHQHLTHPELDDSYAWFLVQAYPLQDAAGNQLGWAGTLTNINKFKQSEQELDQQREFLNALLTNLSDGIVACDRNGCLTLFNRASLEFHGVSKVENLTAEKWAEHYDLYLADGKTPMPTIDVPLFRAFQGESVRDVEMMIKPKYGKSRFLLANGDPIINQAQEKLGAVVAMRDITEQKQALLKLDASEAFLRSIYEGTEVAIFVIDVSENGEFIYAGINPVYEGLTGLSTDFIQGKTPRQVFDGKIATQIEARCRYCVTNKIMVSYEEELNLQGNPTWWLSSLKPLEAEDGRIYRLIGTSINITPRKLAEIEINNLNNQLEAKVIQRTEALIKSEAEFRSSFEQVAVGFAHVGLDGKWLRVNQKLCEIVGYSEAEILNLTFQDITHVDDLATDLNCVQKLLTGEIQSYSLEKRYIRKDGSIVWVEITPSLMRDQNHNQPQYFIVVIEEIEERKQAELKLQQKIEELAKTTEQLTKRNQELDQFTYVASHDLKAPLRAIAHISQWLEEDLAGYLTPENQRQLKILRGRVERMESLINGLLEYSRIGRIQYPVEEVKIELLIKQVIHSLAVPASFQIEIQSQTPIFAAKKAPLFQVLRKIIDNAIQHHDREDGKINVCVRDTGDFWEFSIRDDGIGIAPEYHQKIFTIFQTLEPRDKKENTGVGLSIVKKIIDLEGGEIQIKSQLGLGTEVIFTWPKFC